MERIVITGYGVKTPGGYNKLDFKNSLENGVCGLEIFKEIGPNKESLKCGTVKGSFDEIDGVNYKNYPRFVKLALAAAIEAVEMAGLKNKLDKKTAIFMSTAAGPIDESEKIIESMNRNEKQRVNMLGMMYYHSLSSTIAGHFNLNGITRTLTCGCSSSLEALQDAMMHLKCGTTDVCIVGGSDSSLGKSIFTSMSKLRILSLKNNCETFGIPFSKNSEGFILSEASGVLILEREKDAIKRGANIYAVVEDVKSNNDGRGIFLSEKSGIHLLGLIKNVLNNKTPTYINSQALGIKENDLIEINNYKNVFKELQIPITSIKGIIGHPLGASGLLQVISTLISIEYNFIPKIVGLNNEDMYEKNVNFVLDTIYKNIEDVLITSHGYGGNNSVALIRKYK